MSWSTQALARVSARNAKKVIFGWAVMFVIGLVLVFGLLGDAITTQAKFLNNPDSKVAEELIEDRLRGEDTHAREIVIVRSDSLTVDDPGFRGFVEGLAAEIETLVPEIIQPETLVSFYRVSDPSLVSHDRRTTIIPLRMAGDLEDAEDNIEEFRDLVKGFEVPRGFQVLQVGFGSVAFETNEQSQEDLVRGETFGIAIALIILLLVFGALVAALIPILVAVLSIVVALGIAAIIGQIWQLSFFVTNVATMIGLAVGIDYSLIIIQRYREERTRGLDKLSAIEKAGGAANRTVLFSGITVVLALIGLLLVPFSIFISVGLGAILATLVAILAVLTLLPAILGLLGDRVNKGRIPFVMRAQGAVEEARTGGFWDRVVHVVMGRPIVSFEVAGALLIVLAIPFFDIKLGFNGVGTLPDDLEVKQGFLILDREFSAGEVTPTEIVIEGDVDDPRVQDAIGRLTALLSDDPQRAFNPPDPLEVNGPRDLALLTVPVNGDADGGFARDAIVRLREEYVPRAFAGVPAEVLVGGASAGSEDFAALIRSSAPVVFSFVLALSFVLLMLVFRSIVVPLKAIILNVLSVGAAYGLLVAVFQKGWGNDIFGFHQVDTIEPWIPLFLFAVLFGLSMDYHVFMLSRIRERFDQTGNNRESVSFGLRVTAKLITGAALIMVAVFGGFASGELVAFQQMGFGLAVAILLDATIVRSVLVPSTMALFGRANWYLPSFLSWLPDLRVETGQERGPAE